MKSFEEIIVDSYLGRNVSDGRPNLVVFTVGLFFSYPFTLVLTYILRPLSFWSLVTLIRSETGSLSLLLSRHRIANCRDLNRSY